MKILFLFLGLWVVNITLSQTSEKRVYINPSFGRYRLTTDPNNINNTPVMMEAKIGTDFGKNGIMGFQFSTVLQSIPTSGRSSIQPVGGVVPWTRYGKLKNQLIAFGFFYEKMFSVGKRIDLFPSAYIQRLLFTEIENGNIVAGTDSSMTYSREVLNRFIARVGVNLNVQYKISESWAITFRFTQIDVRLRTSGKQSISGELPFLAGIKFSY